MKKFLLVLIVLFLVVIAGAAVFLATLNLDTYRPQITGKIEQALGLPVQMKKIGWTWHQGVALSLEGLTIQDAAGQKTLLSMDSAKVALEISPLLQRRIQMSTLYLDRPVIHLVRRPSGKIQGFETEKKSTPEPVNPGDPSTATAAALSFFVGKVKIDSGEVYFRDEARKDPIEVAVKDIDIELANVALNEPIEIEAKAGVLSEHQNVTINATLRVTPQEQKLSNFHSEVNLASFNGEELARLSPGLAVRGKNPLSGQLTLDISSLVLNEEGFKNMLAEMHLTDGSFKGETAEVHHIGADAFAQNGSIQIKRLSAEYEGAAISGTGTVNLKTPSPLVSLEAAIKQLSLERVAEPKDAKAPQLKGVLSAGFNGTFLAEAPARTLNGEGKIQIQDGRVENLNVLREIFRKFSMIPGLTDSLMTRLPEDYKDKLKDPHTYFENVQSPFTVQQGTVLLNKVELRSDSFALQGAGRLGLESQLVDGQASIFIEPNLSKALVETRTELQPLLDRNGLIMIPVFIKGKLPNVSPMPDTQYLGSRLAQGVLTTIFKKPEPSPGPGGSSQVPVAEQDPSAPQPPAKQKLPKGSAILGQLLEAALAPQGEQQNSGNSQY